MKLKNHLKGFTLIELLVTMTVLVIVITIGVPSFQNLIKNNRLRTTTNTLVLDINYARSEAVKRGMKVVLCRSSNPQAVNPSCSGNTREWSSGWLLFASQDSNSIYDTGTDVLLKRTEINAAGISIIANTNADSSLTFNSDGSKAGAISDAKYAVCDDRDNSYGREITVINTGRPGLKSGSIDTPIPSCSNPV